MADVKTKGRVVGLRVLSDGVHVFFEPDEGQTAPMDNYFLLPKEYQLFDAVLSMLLAAGINGLTVQIRVNGFRSDEEAKIAWASCYFS